MRPEDLWGQAGVERRSGSLNRRIIRALAWITRAKFTAGSLVVIRHQGEVLLVRERYRDRDRWGLPGGYWHWRECPLDAATRELSEELGLAKSYSSDLAFIATYPQVGTHHIDTLYLLEARTDRPIVRPTSHEIARIEWFPQNQLPSLTNEAELAFELLRSSDQTIFNLTTEEAQQPAEDRSGAADPGDPRG
ncbi:MAG: hydrolase [Actinomycetia bacterium]|nr:hydrolase [Actinomycetes bacterium]